MPKRKGKTVIYMPIETIKTKTSFLEKFDNITSKDWNKFQAKQKEINLFGKEFSKHLRQHSHKVATIKHLQINTVNTVSNLDENDTIYVHSHGAPTCIGLKPYGITAKEVAKRLEDDGLSKTSTPCIKIWACNSGQKVTQDDNQKQNVQTTFANEVGKKLVKCGYNKFTIFGYNGLIQMVKSGVEHKMIVDNTDNQLKPAKQARVGYYF